MRTTIPVQRPGNTSPPPLSAVLRDSAGLILAVGVLSVAVAAAAVLQPLHVAAAAVCAGATALAAERAGAAVVPHLLVLACFVESLGVGSLTIGRLLAVAGLAAVAVRLRPGTGHRLALDRRSWLPVAALVLVQIAGGFWTTDVRGWTFALGQTALALCFFVTFAAFVEGPAHVRSLCRTYVVGACAAALVGCAQALAGARATGLQGDANIYAMYQVAALPAALVLARTTRSRRARTAWTAVAPVLLTSVVLSQSRGAYLALVVTATVVALQGTDAPRRLRALVVLAAVLAAVTATAVTLTNRFSPQRIADDRASGRLDLWVVAWHEFLRHPLTGVGAGGFKSSSIALLTTDPGVHLVKSHLLLLPDGIEVHNVYLEALAERGAPGLVTLLWLLAAVVVAVRRRQVLRPDARLGALVPMTLAFAVAAFFLSVPNNKLLWLLAGIAAALGRPDGGPPTELARTDEPVTRTHPILERP